VILSWLSLNFSRAFPLQASLTGKYLISFGTVNNSDNRTNIGSFQGAGNMLYLSGIQNYVVKQSYFDFGG